MINRPLYVLSGTLFNQITSVRFFLVLCGNKHCERSCELLRYIFLDRFEMNFQVVLNLIIYHFI